MSSCPICVEPYNKTARKCITCPSCQADACAKCVRQFLTENTIEPKCMSCNTLWNPEFLRVSLPRAFMTSEYREHQVASLLTEAETHIPLYQRHAFYEEERDRRNAAREALEARKQELIAQKKALNAQKKAIVREIQDLDRAIDQSVKLLRNHLLHGPVAGSLTEPEVFFMACPRADCRGLVSTAYKCGLCAHFFCPDCHGDKGTTRDAAHECNKDDVDTVRLLKQNTKQCPKCHTGIFKTEGCDQMWCVSCHTCFSWKTGRILNETVHNPHYYEYLRRTNGGAAPRNPGDILCGGIPGAVEVLAVANRLGLPVDGAVVVRFLNIHRMLVHMENHELPQLQRRARRVDVVLSRWGVQLGVAYLRKRISREEWGNELHKDAVEREQDKRLLDLMTMLTHTGGDLLRNLIALENPLDSDFQTTLENLESLLGYANEQLVVINRHFGKRKRVFNPEALDFFFI